MNSQYFSLHDKLLNSLLDVDRIRFHDNLTEIQQTHSVLEMVESYLVPVLQELGEGWWSGKYALSQLYMGGRLCEEVLPALFKNQGIPQKNRIPLAIAVLQDHHVIGKKIVYLVLQATGYHLIDYGSVKTPKELVQRTLSDGVRILLISVLMLPSALLIKEVIHLLEEKGSSVKVVVGGAPFNFDSELWKEVGADTMGRSATEAILLVDSLLKEISDE